MAKIFPIQWLITLLYCVFRINIESWVAVPFHMTLLQSFVPSWKINFTINTPSWFLSSLLFCYLMTIPLLKCWQRSHKAFVALLLISISCYALMLFELPSEIGKKWLGYINPAARLIDYSVGLLLGLIWNEEKHLVKLSGGGKLIPTLAELLCISSMFVFMLWEPLFQFNCYTVIRYPIIILFIVIFTQAKGCISDMLRFPAFSWLGGVSMSIYMTHGFVLHFTEQLCASPIILLVLTLVAVILCAYIVEEFFVKTCNRKWLQIAGLLNRDQQ